MWEFKTIEIELSAGLPKIKVASLEGLIVFPVRGGVIDERVIQIVKIANDFGKPVATTFNEIGLIANPGDEPAEILAYWEKRDREQNKRR